MQVYKTSAMLLTKERRGVIIFPYFNKLKAVTKTVEHPCFTESRRKVRVGEKTFRTYHFRAGSRNTKVSMRSS